MKKKQKQKQKQKKQNENIRNSGNLFSGIKLHY
jgi:hypothetical protein